MNNESQRGYGHHGLFIVGLGHLKTVNINIIQLWLFQLPPSMGLSGGKAIKALFTFMLDYLKDSHRK